ncbi:MAG: 7,8-didemethyl-8-hydroxy-5-deazariboflavin synthase subunit CofH [Methanohalobium sp.]|uniref:7,8-didemethyl-8-hydroxy-5-deazariboflavin synthase subunit CofH n=1 Tax=Methanohalobium sp. TaxID=2837493 RepID=UPI00397E1284
MKIEYSSIPDEIVHRTIQGECTKDDGIYLFNADPFELFALADSLRYESVGDDVTYIINRNINYTNQCMGTCGFCAFRNSNETGYMYTINEIVEKVKENTDLNLTEICIQGGLVPDISLDFCKEMIESIRSEVPDIHIHAFSPMEIYHISKINNISIKNTLKELKNSGLDSMPGTAAEILSDRVREKVCPDKLTTDEWVDVVKLAHGTGIPTTSTMMYGHLETIEERVDHILTIRDIQKETNGITEFVPLPFMLSNNPVGEQVKKEGRFGTTGIEDLKTHALARVLLHGYINNIQASWVKLGKKLAQIALYYGANDLGGTLIEENISKSAGASEGEYLSADEFKWLIKSAGKTPKQRDTLYKII